MPAASSAISRSILGASEAASSKSPRAERASPPEISAIKSRASLVILIFSDFEARFSTSRIDAFESGWTMMTRERERSGEMTSNEGFSVVAPMRVMRPDSTWGKKASC